jgi:hypothetical protein
VRDVGTPYWVSDINTPGVIQPESTRDGPRISREDSNLKQSEAHEAYRATGNHRPEAGHISQRNAQRRKFLPRVRLE